MSEIIFILVTVYVAYVVYAVVNDNKAEQSEHKHEETAKDPMIEALNPTNAEAVVVEAVLRDEIKNPKTGEISKIPNNYRFGKRWIKDALVSEGLLDKVYKNNELNDEVNAKVQSALHTLSGMDKFKV